MKTRILFLLLLIASMGCTSRITPAATVAPVQLTDTPTLNPLTSPYWPTESWRVSTPEEQGMDSQKLEELIATIKEKEISIHSFLVIRNGYIVGETYFGSYKQDTKHDLQSVGRSWASALIGIAIDKGYIDGVDQRVVDFFPRHTFANMDDRKKAMTLEDVLTMRHGLEWVAVDR